MLGLVTCVDTASEDLPSLNEPHPLDILAGPMVYFKQGNRLSSHMDWQKGMPLTQAGPESLSWGFGIENDRETDSYCSWTTESFFACGEYFFPAICTQEAEYARLALFFSLQCTDESRGKR